jgi:DNA-binding transcriptional MerR regulator
VRLSELAETSGTSVATVKFYLREGLLPAGAPRGPRQADYDATHVERLRLVRALVDVGGLSLAAVKDVLAAASGGADADAAVGVAHAALDPRPSGPGPYDRARTLVGTLGWRVDEASTALGQLDQALDALEAAGLPLDTERLRVYADAALDVARYEIGYVHDRGEDTAGTVAFVVLATVLYEPLLLALRRLAQSHVYGTGVSTSPDAPT